MPQPAQAPTPAAPSAPLHLSLQFARHLPDAALHRAALPRHRVARWLRAALAAGPQTGGTQTGGTQTGAAHTGGLQAAEITVRIVGEDEGRQLNRSYRHKDYATNVLTFDYAQAPLLMADLVLCAPVVAREAAALGKPLAAHYTHLLVHGALHAQGWDHETSEADAQAMEAEEARILAALGLPNPYAQP